MTKKILYLFCAGLCTCLQIINAQNLDDLLHQYGASLNARINQYDPDRYNLLTEHRSTSLIDSINQIKIIDSEWQISRSINQSNHAGQYKLQITFECKSGILNNASVTCDFIFSGWSEKNYVLMPAAAYNGNRYPSVQMDYMPFFYDKSQIGLDKPILLSDQPRLNHKDGYSRIQERSGSMSVPSIGFKNGKGKGFWLLFQQANSLGDYGIDIEENKGKTKATISLTSPVVREVRRHWLSRMDAIPSTDSTHNFKAGDKIEISCIINFFDSPSIQSLFDEWVALRTAYYPAPVKQNLIPFSAAYKIQEEKFNKENWRDAGYYAGGVTNDFFQDWQIGWTGGMMTTLPFLLEGSMLTRQRVIKNFDWLCANGVSPSGYYYDVIFNGKPYGAFPQKAFGDSLHLVRKNADATYYIYKQFDCMKKLGIPIKPVWETMNKRALEAQINTWKTYGQLGQFVNQENGRLVIGNTTSAGIFPAALCAAYRYSGKNEYLQVAEEIGNYYYSNFIQNGLACGGPGDAVQSFDSESSYGLLESMTELYEITGKKVWLKRAEEMAGQFSTWIVAYDYKFPESSTFAKLGIQSTGGVFANTQNKTAPGGICTHSGIALLKLYRATHNAFYLNLLKDIAHALPQYMSWKDHPITDAHDGWISERGNLNDWLEGIGETFPYSSWAETSQLLSITELPGVYVNTDNEQTFCIDHVNAKIIKRDNKYLTLEISNTTKYNASVKLLAENEMVAAVPLLQNASLKWLKIEVKAGKSSIIKLKR
jgi:hypothetical protein